MRRVENNIKMTLLFLIFSVFFVPKTYAASVQPYYIPQESKYVESSKYIKQSSCPNTFRYDDADGYSGYLNLIYKKTMTGQTSYCKYAGYVYCYT